MDALDLLAAGEAQLDLAGAGALEQLGLAHGLGVAAAVLGVEQGELLLLREALVLGLLLLRRQRRPERQPRHLEVVELLLEAINGLLVPAGARHLELAGQMVALDAAVLCVEGVLALELLGQFLLGPGAPDELVDVVNLVDQLGLGRHREALRQADLLVPVPFRLKTGQLACQGNSLRPWSRLERTGRPTSVKFLSEQLMNGHSR